MIFSYFWAFSYYSLMFYINYSLLYIYSCSIFGGERWGDTLGGESILTSLATLLFAEQIRVTFIDLRGFNTVFYFDSDYISYFILMFLEIFIDLLTYECVYLFNAVLFWLE